MSASAPTRLSLLKEIFWRRRVIVVTLIYGGLQLIYNLITWFMPTETQAKYQLVKVVQFLSWRTWLIGLLVIAIAFLFEGSFRTIRAREARFSKELEDKATRHQSEISLFGSKLEEKDKQIAELNVQKGEKARRKHLREQLAKLLSAGEGIRWDLLASQYGAHKEHDLWLKEVKRFLVEEPEFDESHVARFEAKQVAALDEFIKEFTP
jgi:hypothetical protein